uniref:CYP52A60 n=1 Tax=Danielia oregonensis TaxID=46584 RepID=A0A1B3B2L0_9ASCO|nr:CYP52A60 [[Candida] oregonensis]
MLIGVTFLVQEIKSLPWWAIVVVAFTVWQAASYARWYVAYKRSGATLAPYRGDGFLGFLLVKNVLKKRNEGLMPEFMTSRFVDMGFDTVRLRIAGFNVMTTRDPENIKAILATQFNDFALGIRHKQFKVVLGEGIFTLDGSGWKHSRAMLRPQFAREQVGHVRSLEPHVQALIKCIRLAKGQEFDIQPLMFKLTIDSGTEFLFGESCESLREDDPSFVSSSAIDPAIKRGFPQAFNISQNYLFTRASLQSFYFLITSLEFRKVNKTVHAFTDYYVNKALNATPEEEEKLSKGGYVFLYELAKQTRDPKVLRDQCLNILLAARDTTAGLLSFTMFELARNPEIFQRLREEIVANFGEGEDANLDDITFESLKKCEYLKWVLNEALRLYPSVPQNFRVATKDTTLPRGGGVDHQLPVFVPKGTTVTYTIYATHRHQEIYGKDAEEYRPSRWGEEKVKKLGWGFLPFNGGPRICLGQQFALTETSYVIVRLLQTFSEIESFETEYPPRKMTHLTMSLFDGAKISLK